MQRRVGNTVALLAIATLACSSGTRSAVPVDRGAQSPSRVGEEVPAVRDASVAKPDDDLVVRVVPAGAASAQTTIAYELGPADCVVRWTLERSGINTGIATQSARCSWPMARQVALLSRLLATMREREPRFRRLHFLDTSPAHPELITRVVLAAIARGWDARRGRPTDGRRADVFLTELLQQGPPLAEWRALSAQHHFAVTADVDEVDVDDASVLPGFTELAARGVGPHDKVIARFVLGLALTPLP